ncbi:MAG: aminoacyl-tRNA hydrolase [Azospira oryzae]|jgi:ribosome-associated protein|nr:MAG: aminoacyl-tRNA hydrolase [Azospira oryzae]
MPQNKIDIQRIKPELVFSTSRSSGPGGQNVNKVNSKVTLKWDISQSPSLTDELKNHLLTKLASRITTEGVLMIVAQDNRSQIQNKEEVVLKLEKLLIKAFEEKKPRKSTKPSKSSVQNRIEKKKKNSEKKQWRQKID